MDLLAVLSETSALIASAVTFGSIALKVLRRVDEIIKTLEAHSSRLDKVEKLLEEIANPNEVPHDKTPPTA